MKTREGGQGKIGERGGNVRNEDKRKEVVQGEGTKREEKNTRNDMKSHG